MAPTHVELYEALKPEIGEVAAAVIANAFPAASDLSTKSDLAVEIGSLRGEMREEFAAVRGEMREGFATLRGEIHAESARTTRWMLGFFIPVWAGTWATVAAVLLKG